MLNDLFDRIGGPRRVLVGVIGLGAAAFILVMSRLAAAPTWVPAITNVPLQSASQLTDRLDGAGIKYKLDRGGAEILVAQEDVARARVTLAKDGLPGGSRPGLELFDRPSWGWNDFTQRVNFRRAMEGELERTIGGMSGVERAEVHLAMPEQSAFRRPGERPVTASVLLALKQGGAPNPDIVRGVAHLVSSSVEGLAPENVSIHDETGRQWSEPSEDAAGVGLSSSQLRLQEDAEHHLARKAEEILSQMVGVGNARVQVAAAINFDKLERTTQSVDPERQALATQQKAEITPGADGGAASTNVSASYDNSKSTEVFSSASGSIRRLTVAVLVNDVRQPSTGPTDTVPRFTPRSTADLARIESLVRTAVGVDSARGDIVSVVSVPFEIPTVSRAEVVPPTLAERVQPVQGPVLMGAGLILAFTLALLAIRAMRGMPTDARLMAASGGIAGALRAPGQEHPQAAMMAPLAQASVGSPPPPRYNFRAADTQVRDKVIATVDDNPDNAARLVKAWIKAN
ncbi:MAG: flagellar basal-body MS-ring/collar protein FliF [Gemmatimonadaceae bacterium]